MISANYSQVLQKKSVCGGGEGWGGWKEGGEGEREKTKRKAGERE